MDSLKASGSREQGDDGGNLECNFYVPIRTVSIHGVKAVVSRCVHVSN